MISAIVITYNEEENIRECLDSLKWCDEIIVVDSNSIDKTREIASDYGALVINSDEVTYGLKRNIGIDKAQGEWILWIDADERVTDELGTEITQCIKGNEYDAYLINRKSFFINKFIKHCGWYPDYTLRLFRKSAGIRFNEALVHEKAVFSGNTGRLKKNLLHFTDRTFGHYIEKLNNYTTLSAKEMFKAGKKAGIADILFRPVFTFFKMYFLQFGFADGFMGLVLCLLSGFHVFAKYSKLYFRNF